MPQPNDSVQAGLYVGGMGVSNDYSLEPGVCVLPIAEEPPESLGELETWSPVVVVKLHAPYRLRRVTHATKKENNPPVMPAPKDVGKFVFVKGDLSIMNALNNTFRNFDWQVASDYLFVETCVSRPQDGFVLGSPPWDWISSDENISEYGGTPSTPTIGAIAEAGQDAKLGYHQGIQATTGTQPSEDGLPLKDNWGYNTPSYYPGVFFSSDMVNGGNSQ